MHKQRRRRSRKLIKKLFVTDDPVSGIMMQYLVLPKKCALWDVNKADGKWKAKLASANNILADHPIAVAIKVFRANNLLAK